MNRKWGNQKTNPTLKTKMGNSQNHKQKKFNKDKRPTEWAAISQNVVTQQPKPKSKYNELT